MKLGPKFIYSIVIVCLPTVIIRINCQTKKESILQVKELDIYLYDRNP